MRSHGARHLANAAAALALALLAACASAPTTTAMQVVAPAVAISPAPGTVAVRVTGGRATSELEGPNITDADFKAATEATLLGARGFAGLAEPSAARYALLANIVRLTKPYWGGTYTVEFEVGWTLLDRTDNKVLLRRGITSTGTATMSDSMVGATRIRLAVEAAARANLEQLARELAALRY